MKHQVIIPQFLGNESVKNYIPRIVKIQKGDAITFINTDNEAHHLYFIRIDPNPTNIEALDEKLYLNSGEAKEIVFNHNYKRIDYVCKIHKGELNSIVIFTEDYKNMSNTQRLKYLRKRYNIKIPDLSIYIHGNR
jgi:plastocyanin